MTKRRLKELCVTEVLCGRGAQCVGQLCVMGLSRREVRGSDPLRRVVCESLGCGRVARENCERVACERVAWMRKSCVATGR